MDHKGGDGVLDDLGVPQLDNEDGVVGFFALLLLGGAQIVNLKVSRTGCGLAASSSDSAGVLARILGLASGHAQAEGVALAGHLHAVGGAVVQRLVVSEPCGGNTRSCTSNSLKGGIFTRGAKLTLHLLSEGQPSHSGLCVVRVVQ